MLKRLGKKDKIAHKIVQYFPPKIDCFYEPFLGGAGLTGVFMSAYAPKLTFYNDLDSDLFNYWQQFKENNNELADEISYLPRSGTQLLALLTNYDTLDALQKAALYFAKSNWIKEGVFNYEGFDANEFSKMHAVLFRERNELRNLSFDDFLLNVVMPNVDKYPLYSHFIYVDSPYLFTMERYGTPKWTAESTIKLMDILAHLRIPFIMSEFDTPTVIDLALNRGFSVKKLLSRYVGNGKKTEILISNTRLKI